MGSCFTLYRTDGLLLFLVCKFFQYSDHVTEVYLGDLVVSTTSSSEVMVEVADAFKHPDYDVISNENDFAVVQLSQSVNYTDFVRPLCLATSQVETVTYYGCYIAGWGTTSYDGKNKEYRSK